MNQNSGDIDNLLSATKKFHATCNNGGVLFVRVPNEKSWPADVFLGQKGRIMGQKGQKMEKRKKRKKKEKKTNTTGTKRIKS